MSALCNPSVNAMDCYNYCCQLCGSQCYVRSLSQVHALAGAAHLVSAFAILTAGASVGISRFQRNVTRSMSEPSVWRFYCKVANNVYDKGTQACPADDRFFFESPPDATLYTVNTLWMAVAFATVSGVVHVLTWYGQKFRQTWTWKDESRMRFQYDYAISAPIMLALFSILWGANNIWGAIVAPIFLCAFLSVAGWLIVQPRSRASLALLVGLTCAYIIVLCPGLFRSLHINAREPKNAQSDRGAMPKGVVAATVFVLVTFSLFIAPYCVEMKQLADTAALNRLLSVELSERASNTRTSPSKEEYKEITKYSLWYASLSLVAKVTLHAMFGITTINQAKFLPPDNAVPSGDPPDMGDDSGRVFGAGGAIIVAGILLYCRIRYTIQDNNYISG